MAFVLGTTKRISVSTYGAPPSPPLTDPSATLRLYVRAAGSESIYEYPGAMTKDATGQYHMDIVLDRVGLWEYRSETMVSGTLVKSGTQSFQVVRQ